MYYYLYLRHDVFDYAGLHKAFSQESQTNIEFNFIKWFIG